MRITTMLDVLALLLVAAGAAAALWSLIGLASLAVAGLVVGVGSWAADRADGPSAEVVTLEKLRGKLRRRGRKAA